MGFVRTKNMVKFLPTFGFWKVTKDHFYLGGNLKIDV
nr:MAG TPA: hypothetical protein [Caudoviricetes sp.]